MTGTNHPKRSGSLLIAVLVCVLVSLSLIATTLQGSFRSLRECKQSNTMRQTRLLVEAGLFRALGQRKLDEKYQGEIWNAPVSSEASENATVEIVLKQSREEGKPNDFLVQIVARIGNSETSINPTQLSRTFNIHRSKL